MGRETLQRTVDLAQNQLNMEVIYGDTDSIMINTNSTDLAQVKELGSQVKREVNKLYKTLELELDGVFKSMLLLKKKKYAALVVDERPDGTVGYTKELKGLDLVRRDWCRLSKTLGKFVLDRILSGESREAVVEAIHGRMDEVATAVRAREIPIDEFVVTKGMNKSIKDYPDAKSQPHLQARPQPFAAAAAAAAAAVQSALLAVSCRMSPVGCLLLDVSCWRPLPTLPLPRAA